MNVLTVKKARKILGKEAQDVSDVQLEKEIETATLLRDLFFDIITKKGLDRVH